MSMKTIIYLLLCNQRRYIDVYRRCSAVQPFKKGNVYHFQSINFTDHFFDLDSRKRVKGKRKSGEVAESDKPAHRQLGVRPYHVSDDSKVLAEYRIKDIREISFCYERGLSEPV